MPTADKTLSPSGQLSADLLVAGAGVMGLWGAVKAAQAGLSVTVVDRATAASGASGGLMGALFPWMPDRWDLKKQFQYGALVALPQELAPLEAATGLSAHFRRVGRLIPLPKPHLRAIHQRLGQDADRSWRQGENHFSWRLLDTPPVEAYIAPELSQAGFAHDTFAARADPRALTAVLTAWLRLQPNVTILEQAELTLLDADQGRASVAVGPALARGQAMIDIRFSHAFIANGVDAFPLLQGLLPDLPKSIGQGVKGQAALMSADLDAALPVVFLDGIYVVVHEGGRVAVGSTSENAYDDPQSTDHQLEAVIAKVRALIPALRDAPVIERWAGIRPKAIGRDPLVGPVPGHPNIIALTGGFKISFGVAHRLGQCAVDYALGRVPEGLPENFTLEGQLKAIG
jgi:glycine oxidase